MRGWSLLAGMVSAIGMVVGAGVGLAQAPERSFSVLNGSNQAIIAYHVVSSPAGQRGWWGPNWMAPGYVLASQQSVLARALPGCFVDARAVYANGAIEDRWQLNICMLPQVAFGVQPPAPTVPLPPPQQQDWSGPSAVPCMPGRADGESCP